MFGLAIAGVSDAVKAELFFSIVGDPTQVVGLAVSPRSAIHPALGTGDDRPVG